MNDDPISLFDAWFAEARASEPNDPEGMALATVDATVQRWWEIRAESKQARSWTTFAGALRATFIRRDEVERSAAALRELTADEHLTVAEFVPAVVTWNRGPLAHLAGDPLSDPRVTVYQGDVAELLRKQVMTYDAILLDVDNGPHEMTTSSNHWLYGDRGIASAYRALKDGGILAVWSAGPDDSFSYRLRQAGFSLNVVRVHAHGNRGTRHVIWLASRRAKRSK